MKNVSCIRSDLVDIDRDVARMMDGQDMSIANTALMEIEYYPTIVVARRFLKNLSLLYHERARP